MNLFTQIRDRLYAWVIRKALGGERMSLPVFNAYAETCLTVPAEFVILRKMKGSANLEVLLFQRPKDDAFFPGSWHSVGGVMLPRRPAHLVWDDMQKKYALSQLTLMDPVFAGVAMTPKFGHELGLEHYSLRGPEVNIVYVVMLRDGDEKTTQGGRFFKTAVLPEKILPHHIEIINIAGNHLASALKHGCCIPTLFDERW